MTSQNLSAEDRILLGLLKDFSCNSKLTLDEIKIELHKRYRAYETSNFISSFIDTVMNIQKNWSPIPESEEISENQFQMPYRLVDLFNKGNIMPYIFFYLGRTIHKYLFDGIFSNAGINRLSTDPHNGHVGFGGESRRMPGNLRIYGSAPQNIEEDLVEAFSYLKINSENPLLDGLKFYVKYVKTHPYYDGNGRIARLILTIYYRYYGYQFDWAKIQNKKFLKLINKCHENMKAPDIYGIFFESFCNFVLKHISKIDKNELNNDNQ